MSYARFGLGGSDVYVFLHVQGFLECCWCPLAGTNREFITTDAMVAHLNDHRAAGHHVCEDTIEDLLADKAENDAWMAADKRCAWCGEVGDLREITEETRWTKGWLCGRCSTKDYAPATAGG